MCGERRGLYRVLVEKCEGSWTFGKPRRRWKDNIKMDLNEFGSGFMDWIEMDQNRDMC
jgi:hypothetical protein